MKYKKIDGIIKDMAEGMSDLANPDCIFCAIAAGLTPVDEVYDGGDTIFFNDISPKAAVHIVGIPKKHFSSLDDMQNEDHGLIGKLLHDVAKVARKQELFESGYRVVTNVGQDAGQEVNHLHFHILGGQPLSPLKC